ncbi:BatD family protein [Marinimicrobium agarilyticum]|uniref:BatD family protein n=1 Tax=Marinimicrobium agarilyticum TaxID=306546 RepID=UPI001B7FAFD8|nr:BatD family protein [Marinimicrobium agarilyticum]
MKNLTRLFLLALFLSSGVAHAQELEAEVDRRTVSINDTLTLTVRQSGRNVSGGPDFESLRENFDILGNQRSHQMRIVNGDMQGLTEWRLTLAPKRTGLLVIPGLELDGMVTEPIEVTVQEPQQSPDGSGQDIFMETEVNKERVHVQEQVLLTVKLYSRVNLDGAELQPLELGDAVVKAVNEENYITEIDGRKHIVLESTFALFPQSSGELVIPPVVYDLAVSRGQRDFWGRSTRRRVRSEETTITVEPIPDSFSGDTWLPAKNVELSQHWSADPQTLRQGEPVTRRITLEAEGLTAAQLPSLVLENTPGVTFYPDRPQTEEQIDQQGVHGTSTLTVAMVPNQSGRIDLPPVRLQWWDTEEDTLKTATLPATTIQVTAIPGAAPSPQASASNPQEGSATQPVSAPPPAPAGPDWLTWVFAGAAFVLLCLCSWFALTVWQLKRQLAAWETLDQQERDQARIARGRAWQSVKRAAAGNDLHALRRALLDWGAAVWPEVPPRGLTDLAERLEDDVARARIQELDALLFRDTATTDFDADALVKALNQSRAGHRQKRRPDAGLQPLYRDQ